MTKTDFLNELNRLLSSLPGEERKDILLDYEEHFIGGKENGKSEEEIVLDLGNPRTIAKELVAEYHIIIATENKSVSNIGRAAIATLSLGFFNLVFALGPFLAIVGVLFGLYIVNIALLAAPFFIIFSGFWQDGMSSVFEGLSNIMATGGLGVLMAVGMVYVSKGVYWLLLKYLRFNMNIIRGEKE